MSKAEPSHDFTVYLKRTSIIFMVEVEHLVSTFPFRCHFYLLFCGQVERGGTAALFRTGAVAIKRASIDGDFVFGVPR